MSGDRAIAADAAPHPNVAYFWGEDAYGIDRAISEMAIRLGTPGEPLAIWRTGGDADSTDDGDASGNASAAKRRDRALADIEQHLATAPLFGGGTLVVIRQPDGLIREGTARARLIGLAAAVPPGNGLAIGDLVASGARTPAGAGVLAKAVQDAGGDVRAFPALTRERMERWIDQRGQELGARLAPGAARLLAERVGAYVRESDVDRRRQTELADQELHKLALLRPDGTVSREDVIELVPEAIPGSTWAFLDAVGARRMPDAAVLAERLLEGAAPPPVLVAQLHRRLRELVLVREHLDAGVRGGALVRVMKLQPFRAQKLEEQAARWTGDALVGALDGLLESGPGHEGHRPRRIDAADVRWTNGAGIPAVAGRISSRRAVTDRRLEFARERRESATPPRRWRAPSGRHRTRWQRRSVRRGRPATR